MNFDTVQGWGIPEGNIKQVKKGDTVLWERCLFRYVSLGDSIAAGHTINEDWETDYGTDSQYGANGNTSTVIVPGSYTNLIQNKLGEMYGADYISTKSFARSGDTVADLMEKLTHGTVIQAIKKADLITICIGANNVLVPAFNNIWEYISTGDTTQMDNAVNNSLSLIENDSYHSSYNALFNRLTELNPNAEIVLMTIYNPYKYLYAEDGANGFFKPVLDTIPNMDMFGFDIDGMIKSGLLNTDIVRLFFDRANNLGAWAENNVVRLNNILKTKVNEHSNKNIKVADAKTLFESFPDRPVSAQRHYNDLVSVEFTRGFNVAQAGWGKLWGDSDPKTFWTALVAMHVSSSGFDIGSFAIDLMTLIVLRVFRPDVDPHPEEWGQYVLYRAFVDTVSIQALDRYTITFNANGGSGSMATQSVVGVDSLPAFVNINTLAFTPATGYRFTGWNTAAGGGGTSYSNGQQVGISGNMSLYAQWSNIYTVTFRHSYDAIGFDSSHTGNQERYALWIDGVEQSDLGAFSNPPRVYELPYGTPIGVIAQVNSGDARSYVTWNGTTVAGKSKDARYQFNLTSDVDINFEWNWWIENWTQQNYWNCYITTG